MYVCLAANTMISINGERLRTHRWARWGGKGGEFPPPLTRKSLFTEVRFLFYKQVRKSHLFPPLTPDPLPTYGSVLFCIEPPFQAPAEALGFMATFFQLLAGSPGRNHL
jgi:hypothetical protein